MKLRPSLPLSATLSLHKKRVSLHRARTSSCTNYLFQSSNSSKTSGLLLAALSNRIPTTIYREGNRIRHYLNQKRLRMQLSLHSPRQGSNPDLILTPNQQFAAPEQSNLLWNTNEPKKERKVAKYLQKIGLKRSLFLLKSNQSLDRNVKGIPVAKKRRKWMQQRKCREKWDYGEDEERRSILYRDTTYEYCISVPVDRPHRSRGKEERLLFDVRSPRSQLLTKSSQVQSGVPMRELFRTPKKVEA